MQAFATDSAADTLAALRVDPRVGLAAAEAVARQRQHGYNEIAVVAAHPLRQLLGKFWGLSAWMLELILVLSAALRKFSDVVVVSGLLVVNAVLGFLQERRAAGVVATLRQHLQVSARVLRDSRWQRIPARELVPGDILRVRVGDIAPADAKVIAEAVSVDSSALTGETQEVDRAAGDMLWSGSIVRHGEADAVVTATGARSYFGRTTQLVQESRPKLHVEAVIARVVRWLFIIVGSLAAAVLVMAAVRGVSLVEVVPLLLVLLMSAVPVALPVMFTVSMAVGARELAKRGVLVTRLSAAEDAATMDVLCVDKTGTITQNRLAVTAIVPLDAATEADVLLAGAFASREANQDPIDLAFLAAVRERKLAAGTPVTTLSFVPFDAKRRLTEAIVKQDGQRWRVIKGAVRAVALECGLEPAAVAALESRIGDAAAKGYRTLAVGRGAENRRPVLLGLVSLYDPPRPDARSLIAALNGLGVAVKMLTGDALAVGREIAREVGLGSIRRVADLDGGGEGKGDPAVAVLRDADGFAEVYPEDKFRVVQHLQAAGHVTGMTGDGVNDAPALRQAEVGIAVSSATDVAKSAASVVLTEPGLAEIVALIEQGRIIYQRVLTWIVNKISRTILKAAFVGVAFVFTGRFVISAFAMLLLVFMTDFAKIALATDSVRPSRKPETWNIGGFVTVAVVLGLAMVIETLAFLWFAWTPFGLAADVERLHTFSFLLLLYFAVFSIVSVRERRWFGATMPGRTLLAALAADLVAGSVLAYAGLPGFAALPAGQWLAVLVYAMVACLGVNDLIKVVLIRRLVPAAAS